MKSPLITRPVLLIHQCLKRSRLMALTAFIVLITFCLLGIGRLEWEEDPMALLPDDAVFGPFRQMQQIFKPLGLIAFVVEGEGIEANQQEAAAEELLKNLRRIDGLHSVQSTPDMAAFSEMAAFFRQHRTAYFDVDAIASLDDRLTTAAIGESLDNWRRMLIESPAPVMADAFASDPLGLNALPLKRLESTIGRGALESRGGWLRGADGQSIVIWAKPEEETLDAVSVRPQVAAIEETVSQVENTFGANVAWVSGHRYAIENTDRIKSDITRTVSLATIAISILALIVFRRLWYVALTLLPAAFGGLIAMGFAGWFRPGISGITLGSGSMLIAISVDYGIHLLFHLSSEPSGRSRVAARLSRPLLLCAGTTVGAFVSLQFSQLPGHRELSVFAMIGIASAAVFALMILPLLAGRPKKWGEKEKAAVTHTIFPRWIAWGRSHRTALWITLIIFTTIALAGIGRVRFIGDIRALNASTPAIENDLASVQKAMGASLEGVFVLTRHQDLQAVLDETETLRQQLRAWNTDGTLDGYRSPTALLPPMRQQIRAAKKWQDFWTDEKVRTVRNRLTSQARQRGMRPKVFEPFLKSLQQEPQFVRLENTPQTMRDLTNTMLQSGNNGTMSLTTLWHRDENDVEKIAEFVESNMKHSTLIYGPDVAQHVLVLLHSQLLRCGFISLCLVVIMVHLLVHRLRRVIALLAPIVIAIIWTFGLLGWAGVYINIINALVAIFIFGLVIDYSVFLFTAVSRVGTQISTRRVRHLSASAGAVGISALTTLIGLGSLTVARHPALHTLGATALIGIAGGWFAVMLLAPLLGNWNEN